MILCVCSCVLEEWLTAKREAVNESVCKKGSVRERFVFVDSRSAGRAFVLMIGNNQLRGAWPSAAACARRDPHDHSMLPDSLREQHRLRHA